jgi:IrrE N-terminal-like domain
MKDLYRRLRRLGFDEPFVRERLLPDWWDDSLAKIPSNRAIAEASISKMLGIRISNLRDQSAVLELPAIADFRLKRVKKTKPDEIAPAVLLAYRAARSIVRVLVDVPPFAGTLSPQNVRRAILTHRPFVDLASLVDFAWSVGIPVFHLSALPKPSKKFSGMAVFCDRRPVIILAAGTDSPPWIAFHLAHELGHVLSGHVTPNSPPLIDSDLSVVDDSEHEVEADRFACVALTNDPCPSPKAQYGLTADKLAVQAKAFAPKRGVDPGVHALMYGRNADRMGVAQNALKLMGFDRGARTIIGTALHRHLPPEVPESTERFVSLTAA